MVRLLLRVLPAAHEARRAALTFLFLKCVSTRRLAVAQIACSI